MSIKNIFAIETSCDETAVSIVSHHENKICIRTHVVESQNESHAPFGGVVPEIAARDHLAKIDFVACHALEQSNLNIKDINSICVTLGPGLIGALMVGVMYARGMASALNIPLVGVNHVNAHLAPCFFLPSTFNLKTDLNTWISSPNIQFPVLALTVSGGHCHLSLLNSPTEHKILGRTLDDACGEAFDKVAKMLNLKYPGGPEIELLAKESNELEANQYPFSQPFAHKDPSFNRYNFSYSGLKTACLHYTKKLPPDNMTAAKAIAFAFQQAALLQLKTRVLNALEDYPKIKSIFVAGGVAQNKTFRALFADLPQPVHFAPLELCSDNATMIALQSILDNKMDAVQVHPFSRYPYEETLC